MSVPNESSGHNMMLNAALAFAASGCSVVPSATNGTKAPIGTWKKFQTERADAAQIATWYTSERSTGLGVVTGAVSGNLEMLELEGRAVAADMLDEIKSIAFASGLGDIWERINAGYCELTPSGGIHWLYRISDAPVPGNTKLARRPGENGGVDVLAETRGEGGYVVVAPSHGDVHPSGRPWVQLSGSPALIPYLTMDERNALHAVFRALDGMPTIEQVREAVLPKADGISPGDDFNARASWDDILVTRGWAKVFSSGTTIYWRRPGKDVGISATTGRNDGDNFYVFTTSTEFEAERPYSKFAALTLLEFGGDFKACARQLRKDGYGGIQPVPELTPVGAIEEPVKEEPADESASTEDERTSWWPRPFDLDGSAEEPAPEFLPREDGVFLFYRGKVNALLGESESGKTWVALYAVQQALATGYRVIYLDFEDSAKGIMSRLRTIGAIDEHLERIVYAQPDEQLTPQAAADLYESLIDHKPDLVIVDGVNAAMTMLGLDLNSNTDATKFSQQVLRPLKKFNAAVVTIDHVTKSKDSRGNYAIGAQSKRADIDGAAYSVRVLQPFGRGINGEIELTVTKDRPGHVRAMALNAKVAGIVLLNSITEEKIHISIRPAGQRDPFRPTHLMEKVSVLLEAASEPLNRRTVLKSIEGKSEAVITACHVLTQEGYVSIANGSRGALLMKSEKAYREASDPRSKDSAWLTDDEDED